MLLVNLIREVNGGADEWYLIQPRHRYTLSFLALPRIKIRDISWKTLDFGLPLVNRKIWQHGAYTPMVAVSGR